VEKIEKEGADAVIVPEFSYGEGFWAQCRVLEKACYYNDPLVDAARFIKKSVWEKLGGLDTSLGGGDDWDFQLRLNKAGYKTLSSKNYIRHYEGKLSLKKQLKKKFVYGKTVKDYFVKHRQHPVMLFKQYSLLRPAYFRNWRLFLKDPIHGLGMLFMKTLEYVFAFMGIVFAVLCQEKINLKKKNSE
jgi:arabinofuranan 3-O-arabinosyltransferase